ncbi:hypothetical protein IT397_02475, partial [Candidatus Nomurabacteria bacterium]|nr:hypothetical protein [Candidatus Nomurabacteria bacterium]
METQNPPAKNYLYELLKKKYHTSEIIRVQIDDIREAIREKVAKEPLKSFVVKFRGRVIDNSFERTLKIISKRQFIKGEINTITTLKEQEIVESTMTATLTEVESLIHYLKKPHVVLHCKKEVAKDASNLLIIDETEQSQLGDLAPDSIHRNCITSAESREKYTGRLGNYLILNGLPLTSEKIGRELRFNRIETKNKVFTTTGLKEIYLNLHFISLILKLDLEQHYLKLRILNSQENDLQMVERKIEDLGFFADIFTHIASKDNPLLFNKDLFVDLSRVEHIVENNDWRAIPAYAGYIYSAATRLNDQFKLLEECGLFLTYANCIEKFIVKLTKKLLKHKPDIHNEQQNLTANYNELKKLQTVLKHPILQADYQELLDSFTKLLAYIDFLTIRGTGVADSGSHQEMINPAEKHHKKSDNKIKNWISSFLTGSINVSKKPVPHHDQSMKTEHEEDAQKLIIKFNEHLQKLSKLETTTGKSAFLEARMNIPLLTNLSYILDQLKELIKKVEGKKDIQDPFKAIFAKSNKFEIFYRELNDEGTIETAHEQESVHKILIDLQKLLFDKPLKESTYTEIINKVQFLENFIINKKKPTVENNSISAATILQAYQNPIF